MYLEYIHWSAEAPPQNFRGTLRRWYVEPFALQAEHPATQLTEWNEAFVLLYQHSVKPSGASTFTSASILSIQSLAYTLFLKGFESDDSIRTTRTILTLSKPLLDHPSFYREFVFDGGILCALAIILMICLDQDMKEETYGLVKAMILRREGVWNSYAIAEATRETLHRADEGQILHPGYSIIEPGFGRTEFETLMSHEMQDMVFFKHPVGG
ncbi:hypothetical protein BJ878DRAFT_74067 [Calycina marina]|uniref:Uncharacterized protein n=1 Tax=Calycina marina TaxID=1763456 RepID=A0A9P7Z2Y9_9HELO|nr:hypothetical protein BJ878DRAFT_74067 [Calycina marina]